MFSVGDVVCYPMHGVGTIEAIEEREVLGTLASYYILCFVNNKMTVMVPVDSSEKIGLRLIISKTESGKVIEYIRKHEVDLGSDNWNRRYRENLDKLKCGSIYDVADVVKCLVARERDKGLSAGERKMLVTSMSILTTELSAATGRDTGEFERMIG